FDSFFSDSFIDISCFGVRRDLDSFPTRRSSDLVELSRDLQHEALVEPLTRLAKRPRGADMLGIIDALHAYGARFPAARAALGELDRKSTRLNSSHVKISYAVFCLKKKNTTNTQK